MKKDWSVFRITMLLYLIVALMPLNYYFAKRSFDSMQSDGSTMRELVYINGAIQRLITLPDSEERNRLIEKIGGTFEIIDEGFLLAPANAEYVALFRADEGFDAMHDAWKKLVSVLPDRDLARTSADKCWREVNSFSKTAEEMLAYKSESMLDRLYLSLIFTMLTVVALIFLIRLYIRVQIKRHAIHDHETGLYNRKYFNEALQKTKLLSIRHESPFSLLTISFEDYPYLAKTLGRKEMKMFLHAFAKHLDGFFRHSDTICRIEGNLFVVILPDATFENSEKLVKRLETDLSEHRFALKTASDLHIGVAGYKKENAGSILQEATDAMSRSSAVRIGGLL